MSPAGQIDPSTSAPLDKFSKQIARIDPLQRNAAKAQPAKTQTGQTDAAQTKTSQKIDSDETEMEESISGRDPREIRKTGQQPSTIDATDATND